MTRHPASAISLSALALAFVACGMPLVTPPLPVLSERAVDSTEPVGRGVIRAVLAEAQTQILFDSLVVPHFPLGGSAHLIKRAWPDSTRAAFTEALDALARASATGPIDSVVVRGLSATLTHEHHSLGVSPIGYSTDSTHAIVYYEVHCGPRCGHGALLLLARRPGREWTRWDSQLLWIS